MLRLFTCAAMALLIGAGASLAQDEKKAPKKDAKKPANPAGQVVSFENGVLKVKIRKEEKEYKISEETPVLDGQGKKATKLAASAVEAKLKAAKRVRITLNEDGSVKQVNILPAAAKKPGATEKKPTEKKPAKPKTDK